jgi:O-methyltransferase
MLKMQVQSRVIEYPDIDDPFFIDLFPKFQEYTITAAEGAEPPWALYKAIEYIVKNNIPGDVVECGVWRGGSMLLAAEALVHFGDTSRKLYLYDTFAGMPRPDDIDKRWDNIPALPTWESYTAAGKAWGFGGTLDMVRATLSTSKYPMDKMVFVQGLVEDTIPQQRPDQISLLRLDTDFYKSTLHELVHLYPLLSKCGILIIDDYGYFKGSKTATDEYIANNNLSLYLSRVNHGVRLAIKP